MSEDYTPKQREAIDSSDKNILLSAGAGSGKTFTLTKRIIKLVEEGTDISEILAVTFTNAAAEELRERIRHAISDAILKNPKDSHLRRQMTLIENARISTIDSFLKAELQPYHAVFMLPPDFEIIDETEASVVKADIMREIIDECYSNGDADCLRVLDSLSSRRHENGLEETLYQLNDELISRSLSTDRMVTLLREVVNAEDILSTEYFKAVKDLTESFIDYYTKAYDSASEAFRNDENPKCKDALDKFATDFEVLRKLNSASTYTDFHKIYQGEYNYAVYPRVKADVISGFKSIRDSFKGQAIAEYFEESQDNVKIIAGKTAKAYEILGDIFSKYRKAYEEAKREAGKVDFADMTLMAEKLFVNEDGTPTELAKKAGAKYKHIFIDEYQDTSRSQDRIFAAIASESNRFTVGDIKQSIYGFRSACPDVFKSYRERYEDGEGNAIFMSNNFRCDKEIIDFSNEISDFIFHDSGTPFESKDKLICSKKDCGNGNVEFIVSDDKDAHNCQIANKIAELLNNGKLDNGERIRPKDIAVLSPTKTYTPGVEEELKKRGIPVFNSTTDSFYNHPETLLLICLLNMVNNPLRDVFLTGAMKSPLFRFSLDDLLKIRGKSKVPFWYSLLEYVEKSEAEPELLAKSKKFIATVSSLRRYAQKDDALEITNRIIGETGFATYGGDESISAADVKNCIKIILGEARNVAQSGGNINDLIKRIDYLRDGSGSVNFVKSEDSVNILTIHKSKGLEFPIVFIIGCCKNYKKGNDSSSSHKVDNDGKAAIKLFDDEEYNCGKTFLSKIVKLNKEICEADEYARLLYVGMTRAKEQLFLCCNLGGNRKIDPYNHYKEIKEFNLSPFEPLDSRYAVTSRNSFLSWIIAAMEKEDITPILNIYGKTLSQEIGFVKYEKGLLSETGSNADLTEFFDSTKNFSYKYDYLTTVPQKLSVSALKPNSLDLDEDEEESMFFGSPILNFEEKMPVPAFIRSEAKIKGTDIGTATHAFMQFCDWNYLIENGAEAEKERLVSNEFLTPEDADLVNLADIELFRNSSLIRRMASAKTVMKEKRFYADLPAHQFTTDEALKSKLLEGGETLTVQGAVDCMFIDKDDKFVLIDYKTDRLTDDEKNDKTLAAKKLIPRHKGQLEMYGQICESILGRKFDEIYIYSVPLGDVIDIHKEEG